MPILYKVSILHTWNKLLEINLTNNQARYIICIKLIVIKKTQSLWIEAQDRLRWYKCSFRAYCIMSGITFRQRWWKSRDKDNQLHGETGTVSIVPGTNRVRGDFKTLELLDRVNIWNLYFLVGESISKSLTLFIKSFLVEKGRNSLSNLEYSP